MPLGAQQWWPSSACNCLLSRDSAGQPLAGAAFNTPCYTGTSWMNAGGTVTMTSSPDILGLHILRTCTRCGLVHDERDGGWLTKTAYRDAKGIDPTTCSLKQEYCPDCYEYFIKTSSGLIRPSVLSLGMIRHNRASLFSREP